MVINAKICSSKQNLGSSKQNLGSSKQNLGSSGMSGKSHKSGPLNENHQKRYSTFNI